MSRIPHGAGPNAESGQLLPFHIPKQYLTQDELMSIKVTMDMIPLSTDTYDESAIWNSISKLNLEHCFALALQFAIVGVVGDNYGRCIITGQEYDIKTLAIECGLKLKNGPQTRLAPGDLTFKRLARFFRYQIAIYIRDYNRPSFLFRKYGNLQDRSDLVFPGAEYMVTLEDSGPLTTAYRNLDQVYGTRFLERLLFPIRIFLKRQISTSPKGLFSLFLFLFLFSFSVLVCFLGGISSQHVSHTTFFFFERFWVIFLFEGFRLYLFAWDGIRDTSYFSKLLSAQGPSSS